MDVNDFLLYVHVVYYKALTYVTPKYYNVYDKTKWEKN